MTTANPLAIADDPLPRYLTVNEFCERFRLSKSFVYELMARGKIRSVKVGSARRIPVTAMLEFERTLTGGEIGE